MLGLCFFLCLDWAAVSALLCLAVPPKFSTCQLYNQVHVRLGNKLLDCISYFKNW